MIRIISPSPDGIPHWYAKVYGYVSVFQRKIIMYLKSGVLIGIKRSDFEGWKIVQISLISNQSHIWVQNRNNDNSMTRSNFFSDAKARRNPSFNSNCRWKTIKRIERWYGKKKWELESLAYRLKSCNVWAYVHIILELQVKQGKNVASSSHLLTVKSQILFSER